MNGKKLLPNKHATNKDDDDDDDDRLVIVKVHSVKKFQCFHMKSLQQIVMLTRNVEIQDSCRYIGADQDNTLDFGSYVLAGAGPIQSISSKTAD